MLVVATLVSVIALIALPVAVDGSDMRAVDAASRIQADLYCAQSRAILLRSPQCFVADTAQGLYRLTSAQAQGTALTDPITRKPYQVFFRTACSSAGLAATPRNEAFPDVHLSSASFDGGAVLTFDALGAPRVGDVPLVNGRIEILSGSHHLAIAIDAVSGQASVQDAQAQHGSGLLSWLLGG